MTDISTRSIEELYPDDPAELQAIAAKLRELSRSVALGAVETFHHASLGYGPTPSSHDRILYISPKDGYVNMGFFYGDSLDGHTLVEGSGKRMRHVKVRTLEAAENPELASLVKAAWKDGSERLTAAKAARKK